MLSFLLAPLSEYLLLLKTLELLLLDNVIIEVLYVFVSMGLFADDWRESNRVAEIVLLAVYLTGHWICDLIPRNDIVFARFGCFGVLHRDW